MRKLFSNARRKFLVGSGLALVLACTALPHSASAQSYPTKPIRLVVPFPPGGGTDLVARIAAEAMSRSLGQSVVVENVDGAASQIGIYQVVKAPNDGYTLLWASSDGISILPAVKPTVPYKIPKDLAFIAGFASDPLLVAINPKLPIKNMKELVAYAKAHPGELKYSSSGVGGGGHLETAFIGKREGLDWTHVPYRGGSPGVIAVVSGTADLTLPSSASVMSYITSGSLRAIATTGPERMKALPDVETMNDAGMPAFTGLLCTGLYAPAGTPQPIQDLLAQRLHEALQDPKIVDKLESLGLDPFDIKGAAYQDYMVKDLERWKTIAKETGITIGGS
jgi:tripartite-type tricarboxylate transporter receptor subunit TctC